MRPPPRFLAIVGPTASGKTDLSVAIAERVGAEIVSMDSRQVYRGMDIGTDKVADEIRARVPHHGLDLVDPPERYSAGQFARDARRWIEEIEGRGRLPLLVGGTGFFLRAVTDPIFEEPAMDEARLRRLRGWLGARDPEELARWVRRLDPDRAGVAVQGGPQRMSRTLEVALLTGRPLSWWHVAAPAEADATPGVVVVLELPRDELDRRIDARVERMMDRGLVEEVRGLLAAGFRDHDPGMSGTGYRETSAYLRGETTLEQAMEAIRAATRQYARRQMTWFRHQLPESALRLEATAPLQDRVAAVLGAWEMAGGRPLRSATNDEGAHR